MPKKILTFSHENVCCHLENAQVHNHRFNARATQIQIECGTYERKNRRHFEKIVIKIEKCSYQKLHRSDIVTFTLNEDKFVCKYRNKADVYV